MTSPSVETELAVISRDVKYMKKEVEEINRKVSDGYVTKMEFSGAIRRLKLLEKIVYTAVSVILLAVLTAMVNLVIRG